MSERVVETRETKITAASAGHEAGGGVDQQLGAVDRRARRSAPPSRWCRWRRWRGRSVVQPRIDRCDDRGERPGSRAASARPSTLALAEHVEPVRIAAHRAGLADALGEAAIERQRARASRSAAARAKRVMISPLTKPAKRADERARATMATGSGRPRFCQNTPSRIAVRPRIEPTERSMPPVMMTKVMASATSPTSVISRPWLSRLSTVKNRSDCGASTSSVTSTRSGEDASRGAGERHAGSSACRVTSIAPAPRHVGQHGDEDEDADARRAASRPRR